MYSFYYLDESGEVLMVQATRKPSAKTAPRPSNTWVMQEYTELGGGGKGWVAHWEITWGTLQRLTYIGKVKHA